MYYFYVYLKKYCRPLAILCSQFKVQNNLKFYYNYIRVVFIAMHFCVQPFVFACKIMSNLSKFK